MDEMDKMAQESLEHLEKIREELRGKEQRLKGSWESLVALYTTVLAILSTVAALLSAFSANDDLHERIQAILHETQHQAHRTQYEIARTRNRLLEAVGAAAPLEDEQAALLEMRRSQQYRRANLAELSSGQFYEKVHVHLAVAVTFFQLAIALGATSVLVHRKSVFRASAVFSALGMAFLLWGAVGFMLP